MERKVCTFLSSPHTPTDPMVVVEEHEERRVLTRRLGGWMEEEDWEEEKEDLAVTLESLGEEVTRGEGRVEVEYQGRLKFWNRRNEIWFMRPAGGRGVLG